MSMVRPTVEFGSCVWDPHERVDINKIEMVQRRGARFVKHRYHNRSSVTDLLEDLKWKSLETRRKESRLTMMYKIVNQQVAVDPDKHLMKPQKQSHSANTNSYVVPYASTTSRQQSFFPRTIRDAIFFLTMFRQQSQYDSRLRFSLVKVLVRVSVMVRLGLELVIWLGLWLWLGLRVRVKVRVRVGFMVRVGVRIMVNLTKTLELNLNRLSYWDCCRNMVRKKKLHPGLEPATFIHQESRLSFSF